MWQLAELVFLSARPQETHNLESFSDVTRLLLPSSPAATQRPARSLGRGQTGVVALPVSPPKPTPPPLPVFLRSLFPPPSPPPPSTLCLPPILTQVFCEEKRWVNSGAVG